MRPRPSGASVLDALLPEPAVQPPEAETVVVAGRPLKCEVYKSPGRTEWLCDEVPFDGIVKYELPNSKESRQELADFGRGSGPSPVVSAAPKPAEPAAAASPRAPQPKQPDPAPPPAEIAVEVGRPIDLLAVIDPRRDAVAGNWRRDGEALFAPGAPLARLQIPFSPPGNYRLEI